MSLGLINKTFVVIKRLLPGLQKLNTRWKGERLKNKLPFTVNKDYFSKDFPNPLIVFYQGHKIKIQS